MLTGITIGLAGLEPAAPTVDRAGIWTDVVKRGPMVRQVRGTGRLVPKDVRWITAPAQGRIERILVLPGASVTPELVLVELRNHTCLCGASLNMKNSYETSPSNRKPC